MATFDTRSIVSVPEDGLGAQKNTKWVVITGASCSGKSTVICELLNLGCQCVPEVARDHFLEQIGKGVKSAEIRLKEGEFQLEVTRKKLKIESALNPDDVVFLDRGMPDSITYYRRAGLDPNAAEVECTNFRYEYVFLFQQLAHEKDEVRNESEEENRLIQKWLKTDYESMGYEVIDVPVMPVKERVAFILKKTGVIPNA